MAEPRTSPPFPTLDWDGHFWRGEWAVPWFAQDGPTALLVRPAPSRSRGGDAGPPPTDAQAAAFRVLDAADAPVVGALTESFRRFVPELAGADWDGVRAFFELAEVVVLPTARDGLAYVGLIFLARHWDNAYEHGVGITLHGDRVAHFGMAEEARDEGQALKDARQQARKRGGATG
jgi:hypothetical protein